MDNGYIYLLFLLLLHCVEWRLFHLISWWGRVSVDGQFPQIFEWEIRWATRNFSLRRISARWNWVEKFVFCAVFNYLFVYYAFIYCWFICLLFNYFKGAVFWFRHQFCGLAPWVLGGGSVFWWVSSGLICSPLDLMQDVMKSLPSFLIYCCYCL